MSYHSTRPLVQIPAGQAKPIAMSGWFGDVVTFVTEPMKDLYDTVRGKEHVLDWGGAPSDDNCSAVRDQSTADLDSQIEDMARSWKPKDVYSVGDMEKTLNATMKVLTDAVSALDQAMAPALTYRATLQQAKDMLNTQRLKGQEFVMAIITAKVQGATGSNNGIQSTGFKKWVLASMNKASVAAGAIAYAACIKPAILRLFQGVVAAFKIAIAAAKAMVEFAIAVGKVILKIPDTALDVMKYLKYGAAIGGAYFLYQYLHKKTA